MILYDFNCGIGDSFLGVALRLKQKGEGMDKHDM